MEKNHQDLLKEINRIGYNLGMSLNDQIDLENALKVCLDASMEIADMDCGGIYLVDRTSGDLRLHAHHGLSKEFLDQVSYYPAQSAHTKSVMLGKTIHNLYSDISQEMEDNDSRKLNEGIKHLSIIPITHQGNVIGCYNIASHKKEKIDNFRLEMLEKLSPQIGNSIARIQAELENISARQEIINVFNSMTDFIFVLDENGTILEMNQIVNTKLGYSREELIGRNVLEVHPPNRKEDVIAVMTEMTNGTSVFCPTPLYGKQGDLFPVETRISRGSWKGVPAIIGVSRDIGDRQKMEIEQNETLDFLDFLVNTSNEFIKGSNKSIDISIDLILQKIGNFDLADRAYVFLFNEKLQVMDNTHEWCSDGIEPEIENLQSVPMEIFPWWIEKLSKFETIHIPDVIMMPLEASAEKDILQSQDIQSVLVVPLVAKGSSVIGFIGFDSVTQKRKWKDASIRLIRLASDQIASALLRINMEYAIRASEKRNALFIKAIPDLMLRVNREGKIIDIYQEKISFPLSSLSIEIDKNKTILEIFKIKNEKKIADLQGIIEHAIGKETVEEIVVQMESPLDSQIHSLEIRVIGLNNDEAILLIKDVTEKVSFEEKRIGFMNMIAHELRSPISTMKMMLELIDTEDEGSKRDEYMKILNQELQRQYVLVDTILSSDQLENGAYKFSFEEVTLERLVENISSEVTASINHSTTQFRYKNLVSIEHQEDLVRVDIQSLNIAVLNLINNSLKYSKKEGKAIDLEVLLLDNYLNIRIQDNGIGIFPEDIPNLFSRYYRGQNNRDRQIKGTGLGLFITKSIIEGHNGNISVDSEIGKNTTFTISLPIQAQK
jgi:PAS domain S-box-containing protein